MKPIRTFRSRRTATGGSPPMVLGGVTLVGGFGLVASGIAQVGQIDAQGGVFSAVAGIVAGIVLAALFVAGETAIELIRPRHVKHLREEAPKRADRLQQILDEQGRLVAACTLAAHVARVLVLFSTLWIAPSFLDALNNRWEWPLTHGNTLLAGLILLIPVGVVHLVFGEVIPRSFAALHPHQTATRLHSFVWVTGALFGYPAMLVTSIASLITNRFGGTATLRSPNAAEEEILTLVETSEERGELEKDERELLRSVFSFTDTVVREVMTPRVDMDALPVRSDPTEVMRLIQESGHSRIPLYEETDDQIVGIIHAKELLLAMMDGRAPNLRRLMREAYSVPENKNLGELLKEMRQRRAQMAVVQDEFGGTAGIVTIEDIVEELVGDIVDEYDVEEPAIVEGEGGWSIDGKTHVEDVNNAIGSQLPDEEFDTIGGHVFGLFGRQPKLDESIEAEGWRFRVIETDGRRIARLWVERVPEASESDPIDPDGAAVERLG